MVPFIYLFKMYLIYFVIHIIIINMLLIIFMSQVNFYIQS